MPRFSLQFPEKSKAEKTDFLLLGDSAQADKTVRVQVGNLGFVSQVNVKKQITRVDNCTSLMTVAIPKPGYRVLVDSALRPNWGVASYGRNYCERYNDTNVIRVENVLSRSYDRTEARVPIPLPVRPINLYLRLRPQNDGGNFTVTVTFTDNTTSNFSYTFARRNLGGGSTIISMAKMSAFSLPDKPIKELLISDTFDVRAARDFVAPLTTQPNMGDILEFRAGEWVKVGVAETGFPIHCAYKNVRVTRTTTAFFHSNGKRKAQFEHNFAQYQIAVPALRGNSYEIQLPLPIDKAAVVTAIIDKFSAVLERFFDNSTTPKLNTGSAKSLKRRHIVTLYALRPASLGFGRRMIFVHRPVEFALPFENHEKNRSFFNFISEGALANGETITRGYLLVERIHNKKRTNGRFRWFKPRRVPLSDKLWFTLRTQHHSDGLWIKIRFDEA